MMTVWGEQLDRNHVWQEYPRPQMRRENYTNWNGLWTYDRKVRKLSTAAIRNLNLQLTGCNQRR